MCVWVCGWGGWVGQRWARARGGDGDGRRRGLAAEGAGCAAVGALHAHCVPPAVQQSKCCKTLRAAPPFRRLGAPRVSAGPPGSPILPCTTCTPTPPTQPPPTLVRSLLVDLEQRRRLAMPALRRLVPGQQPGPGGPGLLLPCRTRCGYRISCCGGVRLPFGCGKLVSSSLMPLLFCLLLSLPTKLPLLLLQLLLLRMLRLLLLGS